MKTVAKRQESFMRAILLVLLFSFLIVSGQVLWKLAIDKNGGLINRDYTAIQNFWNLLLSPYMLFGIGIYMFATVFWMYLLGEYEYSFIYPMSSMTFVMSLFFASYVFDEEITLYKIIGVLIIILGVFIVTKGK